METVLYIVHVLVCLGMLPVILLQSGKGGGVSAVFGGGGSSTVFGSRGASTFLTRMTTGSAIVFMCTSVGLSWYSSQSRSVLGNAPPPVTADVSGAGADEAADEENQVSNPLDTAAPAETDSAETETDEGSKKEPESGEPSSGDHENP